MFIKKAFLPHNTFWKYLLGSLFIVLAAFIGQIPFGLAVALKGMNNGGNIPTDQSEIMRMFDLNVSLFLLLISFVFALLGIILAVRLLHHQKLKDIITTRPKVDWGRIFFAFVIWGVFSAATVAADYFANQEDYVVQFQLRPFLILAAIGIVLIPIQTSVEELVFRGYLMQGFGLLAKNRWFPLLMTSLIFGGLHMFNPEVVKMGPFLVVYYVGTGLLLGVMTLMDEGVELSLGFHAANNLIAALLVTADWTAFQTHSVLKDVSDPSAGMEVIIPVLVIYPLLLLLFSKKYKWNQWKEKLTGKIIPEKDIIVTEIGANDEPTY